MLLVAAYGVLFAPCCLLIADVCSLLFVVGCCVLLVVSDASLCAVGR